MIKTQAIESFMRDYYLQISEISRINDILLQLLQNKIINFQTLDKDFIIKFGYIKIQKIKVFSNPANIIKMFDLIAKHNYIKGIETNTLRELQKNLNKIDKNYHKQYSNAKFFIQILQQKTGVNFSLKLMHRYGFLEKYIPDFAKIKGLMQYDLFHSWTVDEHSLFVVRNLRRFFIQKYNNEFPLCSKISKQITKPKLLILAGLFHDIGKGRGGNHSQIGAQIVKQFCKNHQLNKIDTQIVVELVNKHLSMSNFINNKDISDIAIIKEFALIVKTKEFLKMLYLLTVADIHSTKKELWNDWKDALLKQLFNQTFDYLTTNKITSENNKQQIFKQKQILNIALFNSGFSLKKLNPLLQSLPSDYFIRFNVDDMLWHLTNIFYNFKTPSLNLNQSKLVSQIYLYIAMI